MLQEEYLGSPDNPRTAAYVGYITIIGWLIAYYALYTGSKRPFAAFHLRQALFLHLLAAAVNILALWGISNLYMRVLTIALAVLLSIAWLMAVLDAVNNRQRSLPLLGSLAQRLFAGL